MLGIGTPPAQLASTNPAVAIVCSANNRSTARRRGDNDARIGAVCEELDTINLNGMKGWYDHELAMTPARSPRTGNTKLLRR